MYRFKVTFDDIHYHGKVLCSTQMNQHVHLFSVDVNKADQGKPTTDNPVEQQATVKWCSFADIVALEDWKAVTIVAKRLQEDKKLSAV